MLADAEASRAERRAMATDRWTAAVRAWRDGSAIEEQSDDGERDALDRSHGRAVAGSTGAFWALEVRVYPVRALAGAWGVEARS